MTSRTVCKKRKLIIKRVSKIDILKSILNVFDVSDMLFIFDKGAYQKRSF